MSENKIPFLVTHYTPESARKRHIEREWASCLGRERFQIEFITSHDREQPLVKASYVYDEHIYREMIQPIKNLQIGYWIGLYHAHAWSFNYCVEWHKSKNTTLDEDFKNFPWLRPSPLSLGDVSLILKHRDAWARIAEGDSDFAVVAEDDIIVSQHSLEYLIYLIESLPTGADYIDIAGGGGDIAYPDGTIRYILFKPRVGNGCVNKHFFEIFPPKTRTTCGAIITRSFARRLIDLNPPICLGFDWMLNWAFAQLGTKVYWVEPTVFGHGSQMNIYKSIREAERRE